MASETELSDVLGEFARTMVAGRPVGDILEHLLQRIVSILPITAAGVSHLSPYSVPRYLAASDASAVRYEELQTELGEGPCLAAYRTGRPVAVPDLRQETRFELFAPRALDAGLAAAFIFPLCQGDRPLGTLDLYRDTPGMLSERDLWAAQTLADITSAYLVNAQARLDLQESSNRSCESSLHDSLTGLPNRVLFLERLDHALERARRSGKLVAVLFVDIDDFKAVNEVHGHRVGDELLVAAAQRLSGLVRPGDTLARLSGDEFIVICEELDDKSQGQDIAQRIVESLSSPFGLSGIEIDMAVSVGVAFRGFGETVPELLLHDADVAMSQAKRNGGRCHQMVDVGIQRLADVRTTLQGDVRAALRRNQLRLDYQPIVRSDDGQINGFEAFLRWDHPTRGPVPPSTLVPLADASGLITEIGRWVLTQACTDRERWVARTGRTDLMISVNVSAHQLMVSGFVDLVGRVLNSTDTPPGCLVLEVTESAFVHDPERAVIVLSDLKRLGALVALDDFGTGYSSLDYLKRYPIDVVKIDGVLVADLARDPASEAIVSAVVELAHVLGSVVVAEGVEMAEQRCHLVALGSDSCQGFHFAQPMSADKIDTLLEHAIRGGVGLPIVASTGG